MVHARTPSKTSAAFYGFLSSKTLPRAAKHPPATPLLNIVMLFVSDEDSSAGDSVLGTRHEPDQVQKM
jgi:hypothetical protein